MNERTQIDYHLDEFLRLYNNRETIKGRIDILFSGLIHGDEPAPILGFNRILNELYDNEFSSKLNVDFIIGNLDAARQGKRFLEKDLNRCFGVNDQLTIEDRIAKTIEEKIVRSRYAIDFHQTSTPTRSPFWIFPDHPVLIDYASRIAPQIPIVCYAQNFEKNALAFDEFALENSCIALTIELGQNGLHEEQAHLVVDIIKRSIRIIEAKKIFESTTVPEIYQLCASVPNDPSIELLPDLQNFTPVTKGDVIANSPSGQVLSPVDGIILFPKYQEKRNQAKDLIRFAFKRVSPPLPL